MAPVVRLLEHPTDDQVEQSVALVIRAFTGDLSLIAMTGGNTDLQAPLFRSMLRACAVEGSYYVVMDEESGAIHSVGGFFGPGQQVFTTEKQREQGWTQFFNSLPQPLHKWWNDLYLPLSEGELNKLLGDNYLNGWFANIIATDPPFQRRGYAASIIRAIFQRAASEEKPVSLATQTEENCLWYQSLGFKELGKITIPADSEGGAGSWPFYILTWESP
ncbi:hypothetical protein CVT26_000283 [Gymnopilus dilepis]|uniref:N-acetyltransferase domain-containing protein n=1 Tax=Gymnopilus dilepis TaxID=231916 RepID=A0A409WBH4_9AGAR|nr:hypothetical protein CVT26_000283 [Gymnopilus dilepis]